MTTLHHRIHLLEVADPHSRALQSKTLQQALLLRLDETHWVVDDRWLAQVEQAFAKAGVQLTVVTHGE